MIPPLSFGTVSSTGALETNRMKPTDSFTDALETNRLIYWHSLNQQILEDPTESNQQIHPHAALHFSTTQTVYSYMTL